LRGMETFFTNIVFSNARSWRVVRHTAFWLWWVRAAQEARFYAGW
jgi:hypothetical protein